MILLIDSGFLNMFDMFIYVLNHRRDILGILNGSFGITWVESIGAPYLDDISMR